MVAPIVAAKAGKSVGEAVKGLTGDLYVRRWTSVTGKGKKKKAVEHEARVNVATVLVGAVAAGVGVGTYVLYQWAKKDIGEDFNPLDPLGLWDKLKTKGGTYVGTVTGTVPDKTLGDY